MADEYVRRYATDGYYGFANFERGLFAFNERETLSSKNDNPEFIWPPKSLHNPANNTSTKIRRGYMRMISQGFGNTGVTKSLAKTRLHFQFNPDTIVRSVAARNDIQLWMNMDPVQMTQAIPGDANFSFELLFNREAEVTSGKYKTNGTLKDSRTPADLFNPLFSDVTEIGVLADLRVFDQIIGQGINKAMIDSLIANVQKTSNNARTAALTAASSDTPMEIAEAQIILDPITKKISKVQMIGKGNGYVSAPAVLINKTVSTDFVPVIVGRQIIGVTFDKVKDVVYNTAPSIEFQGGGGLGSTSASTTSDAQDQIPPEFDAVSATKALNYNIGNSAFLVSLPVRLVFSSLFMVEGYVTSTQVTFNKFTPTMVPTQCAVGITMQAMYIGFAKEKTYFTNVLTDAYNTKDTGGTLPPSDSATSLALIKLGGKLFNKFEKAPRGRLDFSPPPENMRVSAWLGGDAIQDFAIRLHSSPELQAALDGAKTVSKITANLSVIFTYTGNSSGSVSTNWPPTTTGEYAPTFAVQQPTELNLGNLKKGEEWDSVHFKACTFSDARIVTGKEFDGPMKSGTSLWDSELLITFDITSSTGESVRADQYFYVQFFGKHWDEDVSVINSGRGSLLTSQDTSSKYNQFKNKWKSITDVAGGAL